MNHTCHLNYNFSNLLDNSGIYRFVSYLVQQIVQRDKFYCSNFQLCTILADKQCNLEVKDTYRNLVCMVNKLWSIDCCSIHQGMILKRIQFNHQFDYLDYNIHFRICYNHLMKCSLYIQVCMGYIMLSKDFDNSQSCNFKQGLIVSMSRQRMEQYRFHMLCSYLRIRNM